MPLISEEEIELVLEAFPELREQVEQEEREVAEQVDAQGEPNDYGVPNESPEPLEGPGDSYATSEDEDMQNADEQDETIVPSQTTGSLGPVTWEGNVQNEPNDYGVPYEPPEPFWVGPSDSNATSEDEDMHDADEQDETIVPSPNAPPPGPATQEEDVQNEASDYGVPYESPEPYVITDGNESDHELEVYEEVNAGHISDLALIHGVEDEEGLIRLAQSPLVFHEVSRFAREWFLNRELNFRDYAGWHLARRVFLVGSENMADVGINRDETLLPYERVAEGLAQLFEFMEDQRRQMGLAPLDPHGSKSLLWRVYYGVLSLYLNSNPEMWHALLTDDNSAENWTDENQRLLCDVIRAINDFEEELCGDEEYDPTYVVAYQTYPRQ